MVCRPVVSFYMIFLYLSLQCSTVAIPTFKMHTFVLLFFILVCFIVFTVVREKVMLYLVPLLSNEVLCKDKSQHELHSVEFVKSVVCDLGHITIR